MVHSGPVVTLAHVSDLHLDGGSRAAARAHRVVSLLAAAAADVVLVSGDVADHGTPAEYDEARALLARLPQPVAVLPGNHDVRAAFRAGLLDEPAGDAEINRIVRVPGADLLLCDSTIPGESAGRLSDRTLAWLDAELAAGDAPAFVCFHHPPVILHAPLIDPIRQGGADRLAAVLERHPRVAAVLCGHAHTAAATTFAGRPLLVAPGVASTIRAAAEPGPEVDLDLPPAVALHVLDDDGRLVTHYRPVP